MATAMEASQTSGQPNNTNKCDPCAFDTTEIDAVAFCVDCVEYLCLNCLIHHKKIKATREHKVCKQENMPADRRHFSKMQALSKCCNHIDIDVEFKCLDHDQYICVQCERSAHNNCKKIFLTDIPKDDVNKKNDKIRKHISALQNQECLVVQAELQSNILHLSNEKARILEQRQKKAESLENAKAKLEKKTSQFSSEAQRIIDKLIKEMHVLETLHRTQTETESFLNIVLEYGTPYQLIITADKVCKDTLDEVNLGKLSRYRFEDNLDPQFSSLSETLLTVGQDVTITEDISKTMDATFCTSSDFIADDVSDLLCITDRLTEDEPDQNQQGDHVSTIETLAEKTKQLNPESDIRSKKPGSAISTTVIHKEFSIGSKDTTESVVDTNKKNMRLSEVLLNGISGTRDKLDVAVTMNGFCVVTTDHARTVLLLNEKLQVVETLRLKTKPVSICSIEKNRVAILCLEKLVRKYDIGGKGLRKYHEFMVNKKCYSIARYGEKDIAFLYAGTPASSTKPKICLEIRDHLTGNLRKLIQTDMILEGVTSLSMFSTTTKELVISDRNVIKFFSESGKIQDTFESQGTMGVTGDDDGNIYIFNYSHNVVVVTSKLDKHVHTYPVVSRFAQATLTYDLKSNRLILIGLGIRRCSSLC